MRPIAFIRRRVFDLSQAEFGAALNVNQSTVSRWENGTLEPSREEMAAIRELAVTRQKKWEDRWFFDEPPAEKEEGEAA